MKKELRFVHLLPGIVWFVIMSLLFFLPGDDIPSEDWIVIPYFDKLVHFGLFFILISLFAIPVLRSSISAKARVLVISGLITIAIAWGIIVEVIQENYVPGRTFDLWDWLADSLGVVAGVVLLRITGRIFRVLK